MIVLETSDPSFDKAHAPSYGGFDQRQALDDSVVGLNIGAAQDDACPRTQRGRQRTAARKQLQLRTLLVAQQQWAFGLEVLFAASPPPRYRIGTHDQCQLFTGRHTRFNTDGLRRWACAVQM